jgi:Arylsulfotransferase (ASST)
MQVSKPRQWFNMVKDGELGNNGRVRTKMASFVSVNADGSSISATYYDSVNQQVRRLYGRDPSMSYSVQFSAVISSMVASNDAIFAISGTDLLCLTSSSSISLSSIQTDIRSPTLQKCDTSFLLSLGSSIYEIIPGDPITYNLLVSDYSGKGFQATVVSPQMILSYSSGKICKAVLYTVGSGTPPTLQATLSNTRQNTYSALSAEIIDDTAYYFAITNSTLYQFELRGSTLVQTHSLAGGVSSYMARNVNGTIYIIFANKDGAIWAVSNGVLSYVSDGYPATAYDVTNINDEVYVYYIDTQSALRQAWNPISRVYIQPSTSVDSIIASSASALSPSYAANITDYILPVSSATASESYTITINGETYTDTGYAGQLICIQGRNNIYIKLTPPPIGCATTVVYPGYSPGYYLTVDTFGGPDNLFYCIYDLNGVPVWYRAADPDTQACSLFLGNARNKVATVIFNQDKSRTIVDVNTLKESNFATVAASRGGVPGWDVHEALEIAAPASRKGNMLYGWYNNGFYIQEQSPDNKLVWDFYSTDIFSSTDPEFFHFNAFDVHPVTGDIICSFRTVSSVVCINYRTKNLDWAIDSNGGLLPATLYPEKTKFLTPTNEPVIFGVQYNGTSAQHDCRWRTELKPLTKGNTVISIYDDQSFNGRPAARGVVYEIDLKKSIALFRGNVYSTTGTSGYMGSYKIVREFAGTYSHVLDLVQQHPCLREYASDANNMPTQTQLFSLDLPGDHYQIAKANPRTLSITAMRNTSGMPFTTVF